MSIVTNNPATSIGVIAMSWLGQVWSRGRSVRRRHLDVAALPDHLKRDMGFLDGSDPCGRHLS